MPPTRAADMLYQRRSVATLATQAGDPLHRNGPGARGPVTPDTRDRFQRDVWSASKGLRIFGRVASCLATWSATVPAHAHDATFLDPALRARWRGRNWTISEPFCRSHRSLCCRFCCFFR